MTTRTTPAEGMRTCIGSAKFGIKAHEVPLEDFPIQPSQRDGRGRMCHQHWTEYTRALRKVAGERANAAATPGVETTAKVNATAAAPKAKKAAPAKTTVAPGRGTVKEARAAKPEPIRTKAPRKPKGAEVPAEA